MKITKIGSVNDGIDGSDEYFLVERLDKEHLTSSDAQEWMLERCYVQSNRPGGYYCHNIRAVQAEHSDTKVICAVQHRYDV